MLGSWHVPDSTKLLEKIYTIEYKGINGAPDTTDSAMIFADKCVTVYEIREGTITPEGDTTVNSVDTVKVEE